MMEIGTPLGLGFASGINAYLPLLSFAVSARWLHLYKVNPTFAFITSNWCIIALVILTIADFVADKIPIVDHTWDATHTFIRPLTGALVAAASSNLVTLPMSTNSISSHLLSTFSTASSNLVTLPMSTNSISSHLLSTFSAVYAATGNIHIAGVGLLVIALLGGILAAMSHTTKATTRLVSTFTTAGLLNVILSFGEDILVCIAILLSLLVPAIMLILIVLFFLIFAPLIIRARNRQQN
jgi:Domain of unknown function (DUF4126)